MTRLPRITGREIIAALRKAGFEVARIKGSHHSFVTPTAVEPSYLSTLVRRLLAAILRDCEIQRDEFLALLCFQASNFRFQPTAARFARCGG